MYSHLPTKVSCTARVRMQTLKPHGVLQQLTMSKIRNGDIVESSPTKLTTSKNHY